MRDFGTVATRFWTGGTGKRLRGDLECQVLAVYLMSSPHSSMTGLYHLPMSYISEDTGIPFEGASKALLRLSKEGFCIYDEETDVIFVVNMAKHQIGDSLSEGDKRRKWLKKELQKLPATALLLNFYEKYGKAYLLDQEHGLPNNMKPLRSPLQAPKKPLRSQDMDMDREQDRNREQEREARTRDRIENDIVGKDPDLRAVQNAPDFSVVEMMSGKHKMVGTRILEHWPQYEPAHVPETVKDFMYYVGDFEPHDLNELLLDASKRWSKDRPLYDGRGNRLHPYLVSTAQIASRAPKNGNGPKGIPYKETAAEAQVRRNHEVLDEWLREKEGNHGR